MRCDDLIFDPPRATNPYDTSTWKGIAGYVVERLARAVGHGIHVVGMEEEAYQDGFSLEIRSNSIGVKPWHFRNPWRGRRPDDSGRGTRSRMGFFVFQ